MPQKIQVNDNAGVFVRFIDKSQRPSEPSPIVMSAAFAVESERGFMHQIYYVRSQGDVARYFGKKNWRTFSKSMYDLDKYLEGGRPAYVVRVGSGTGEGKEWRLNSENKCAYVSLALDKGKIGDASEVCCVVNNPYVAEKGVGIEFSAVDVWEPNKDVVYVSDVDPESQDITEFCRIYAKGEGPWGGNVWVVFNQRDWAYELNPPKPGYKSITALPRDRFQQGDGGRIFSIDVRIGKDLKTSTIVEQYDAVSFNPRDRNKSGTPIYIKSVLATSNYVEVTVNPNPKIDPELLQLYVLPDKFSEEIDGKERYAFPMQLRGGTSGSIAADTFKMTIQVPDENDSTKTKDQQVVNPDGRSNLFMEGLNLIFRNWDQGSDPWFAVNAGSEIRNSVFAKRFGHARDGKYDRAQGLTSVVEDSRKVPWPVTADAFSGVPASFWDDLDTDDMNTPYVCKWPQWIEGWDSDTSMNVFTSPVGWVAKILAQNDVNGNAAKAPSGYKRGVLRGVKRLSRIFDNEDRLKLVEYKWNPIKQDDSGYTLWDELTAQAIDSSLSNLHVMWAWQRIRRGIESRLRDFIFEDNDENTVSAMLGLLRNQADGWRSQGFINEYNINADNNRYGTDQIYINWDCTFKESARTIVVDVTAYRSDQPLSVSLAENPF